MPRRAAHADQLPRADGLELAQELARAITEYGLRRRGLTASQVLAALRALDVQPLGRSIVYERTEGLPPVAAAIPAD